MPEVTKSNRNHITTIVNGRVVKNNNLYRCINDSYCNYKEDTRYPVCVLIINTDPSLLDVNIHPSKLDIRFSNFEELTNLISKMISDALKDKLLIPSINVNKDIKEVKYEELTLDIDRNNNIVREEKEEYRNKISDLINFKEEEDNSLLEEDSEVIVVSEENKLPELYPVVLLHGTYIVCENELGIYLIDQHAAKERINYEHISEMLSHPSDNTISPIVPIVIELALFFFPASSNISS